MPPTEHVAVAGIGETDYSRESGRSELMLSLQAINAALEDAGLEGPEVDGLMRWAVDTSPEATVAESDPEYARQILPAAKLLLSRSWSSLSCRILRAVLLSRHRCIIRCRLDMSYIRTLQLSMG